MTISNYVGNTIKSIRKKRGLTQQTIAEQLNMSQSAYAKIENGRTILDVNRLKQLSDILSVDIIDLFPKHSERDHANNRNNRFVSMSTNVQALIASLNAQIQHLEGEVLFLRSQLDQQIKKP